MKNCHNQNKPVLPWIQIVILLQQSDNEMSLFPSIKFSNVFLLIINAKDTEKTHTHTHTDINKCISVNFAHINMYESVVEKK